MNGTNDHQRETSWIEDAKVNAQAPIDTLVSTRATQPRMENRNRSTSGCTSNGGTAGRDSAGAEDAGTEKESNGCKDNTWDRTRNLARAKKQDLLSLWEGCHWDDNNGGWIDPKLCAEARREEVTCLRASRKAPIKTGWVKTGNGRTGSSTCLRGGLRGKVRLTQDRVVRVDAAAGGGESGAVRG